MPKLKADGLIEYTIPLVQTEKGLEVKQTLDVEWIMNGAEVQNQKTEPNSVPRDTVEKKSMAHRPPTPMRQAFSAGNEPEKSEKFLEAVHRPHHSAPLDRTVAVKFCFS